MPELSRLNGSSSGIQLDFVEREATPRELMRLSIQLHLAKLSLSDTVSVLERFGVERARSTIHNWVQKADLQPAAGKQPDHVALDETVIQLDDQRYWLYAAIDPKTHEFLHFKLYSTRTTALTEMFLRELTEKHDVEDAVFLVDSALWLKAALHHLGLRFRYEKHGNWNAVERLFQEIKRHTSQFGNCFRNADPATAETWLQSYAYCWNQLI
ncbi:IS6 family transposase [Natrinema versiforme]|uniref:IS6 family transposase n=1 Tax=Natrinema versiforme TaxID=88724 RepID=A0A4P8WK69_9EURY|nr:IS6 family transposase [Natrinema versiforme]QCS42493.1 IS6 family transposase [Natrinema versiforme]